MADFTFELRGDSYAITNCTAVHTGVGEPDYGGIVTIPDTYNQKPVTTIAGRAINKNAIKEIIVPDSITTIGRWAFRGDNLTTIQLGAKIKEASEIFSGKDCPKLREIKVDKRNHYLSSMEGVLYTRLEGGGKTLCYPPAKVESSFSIPNDVTRLSTGSFVGVQSLRTLHIPASVRVIYAGAFESSNIITFYYEGNDTTLFNEIGQAIEDSSPFFKTGYRKVYDTDYLGFTFNGKHSLFDLNIIRVSKSNRYNEQLSPQSKDQTAEVPMSDGSYFFGTQHTTKQFSIDFTFDSITDIELRQLRQFASQKELGDLIFDEEPYKVYTAKITGMPSFNYIPFYINGERIYKGEGQLQFTCFYPYAHTPNAETKISSSLHYGGKFGADGKILSNYDTYLYPTKAQWMNASGLQNNTTVMKGENHGDLPSHFILTTQASGKKKITIGNLSIEVDIGSSARNLVWDSKTGIVKIINGSNEQIIPYDGIGYGTIPVDGLTQDEIKIQSWSTVSKKWVADTTSVLTLNYHYWYY